MRRSVRTRDRLGPEWVLVPLALGGGILVGFHLTRLRQPAARFLLPGRIAYDVAQLVTPQPPDESPSDENPTAPIQEMQMASERDAQEKREGVGNRPPQTPPPEQQEEKNASPAQAEEGGTRTDREASRERASTSMESPTLTTKSTEGITVGGTEKTPSD